MIFLKGLVHGFDQKLAIIHFRRNRPGKCVSRFSRKKNALVDDNNKKLRKSKNWDFSKGVSPSFWSKSVYFFAVSFEPKQARKIFFTIS